MKDLIKIEMINNEYQVYGGSAQSRQVKFIGIKYVVVKAISWQKSTCGLFKGSRGRVSKTTSADSDSVI